VALVAAPYGPFWNLNAPDDAGWRAIVKQFDDAALPALAHHPQPPQRPLICALRSR
jgi:hypothetical protein